MTTWDGSGWMAGDGGAGALFATVAAVGSSISAGGYPDNLDVHLTAYTSMNPAVVRVAQVGRTTANMHDALPAGLSTHRPTIVILETSPNDSHSDNASVIALTPEVTQSNLRKMVGMARLAGALPILLTSTPLNLVDFSQPAVFDEAAVSKQLTANELTRDLAADMGVLLVDLYQLFQNAEGYHSDRVHLNATGNDLMGHFIAAAITGNVFEIGAPFVVEASDDFDRADSSTLGVTPIGGLTWTNEKAATWGVSGGAAVSSGSGHGVAAVAVSKNAQSLEAVLQLVGTNYVGVTVRGVDSINFLKFAIRGSDGGVFLQRHLAGVDSTLAAATVAGTGDRTLKITAVGNEVLCYVDGALVISHTLSGSNATTFAAGKRVGIYRQSGSTVAAGGGIKSFAASTKD